MRNDRPRKVTISMPDWMLEDLRTRGAKRGVPVVEYIRLAVIAFRESEDTD